MKARFTSFACLLMAMLFFQQQSNAQAAGDYRSNIPTATGLWTVAANWEVFDGVIWNTATLSPTAADGVITIRTGDSVRLNSSITIDQVVIEGTAGAGNQAVLTIFNTAGNVTLANGAGDDIVINPFGRLYVAAATTLTGPGNVANHDGGLFTLRNTGVLNVPVVSDGIFHFGQPGVAAGTISGVTVTINDTCTWIEGNLVLSNGATLVNNDTITLLSAGAPTNMNNGAGTNTFVNNGVFIRTNATGASNIFPNFTNTGTIAGIATFNGSVAGGVVITNTGTISPGSSPGQLTVTPNLVTGQTPTIRIEILDGTGAGTGHDKLNFSGTTDLSGAKLVVTENTASPVQSYTIMETTTGTFTGNFASVLIPTSYTLTYVPGGTTVIVNKTSVTLPLVWGEFTAIARNNQVQLNWSTLQESDVSHFVVEYSTDGRTYNSLGTVTAAGNTNITTRYSFNHANPDVQKGNYYRIREIDLDGKNAQSPIRLVRFRKGNVVAVIATPNPMTNVLQLSVQGSGVQIMLSDINGKVVKQLSLQPGFHEENVSSLASGMYQMTVYEKGAIVERIKLIKQ